MWKEEKGGEERRVRHRQKRLATVCQAMFTVVVVVGEGDACLLPVCCVLGVLFWVFGLVLSCFFRVSSLAPSFLPLPALPTQAHHTH